MSTWTLVQIVFDIFMACGIFVIIMRMNRAPKDDPRLSRGLQLLQSKISVLEDLSDRTEAQVTQLTSILESKAREVQMKVELADRHVQEIRVSMDRSLEVASIFQDKIPHKEIIERQNTIKYVQAARLAHSGLSVHDIAKQVDLPRGELDFILSVNKDCLMFTESELPEWAKETQASADVVAAAEFAPIFASDVSPEFTNEERAHRLRSEIELSENQRLVDNLSRLQSEMQSLDQQLARENNGRDFAAAYEIPKVETDHLKKLGEEFRKAVRQGEVADARQSFGANFANQTAAFGHSVSQAGKSMLPSLENLAALIPTILEAGATDEIEVARVQAPRLAAMPAPRMHANAVAQATAAEARQEAANKVAMFTSTSVSAPAPTPAPTIPKDPVLARAVAHAKVQAALRSSARPSSVTKKSTPELSQARAVARDLAGNIVQPAKPGEVRRVMFPRIDGSDI